jgi:Ca2+-binding EF-hand superfamily protein
VSKEESQQVLTHFDRDKNGSVDFNEFIRSIRGDLNAARKAIVRTAYQKLDANRDGQVTLDDIAKVYDANRHPDVVSGRKSAEQIYLEFMRMWDTQERDSIVTFDEFSEYYADLSSAIDDDNYFITMMRNTWEL